jgi:hypothetical protein
MNARLLKTVAAAQKAVNRVLDTCRKDGQVYRRNPKVAAQVNRTSKWLLNALNDLQYAVESSSDRIYFPPS